MTQRPIDDYLIELSEGLSRLPCADREELLREVRMHLEDAAAASPAGEPGRREEDAIQRFGPAAEIARSMVAEALLHASTRGFQPIAMATGLAHGLVGGTAKTVLSIAFSLAYVSLLLLGVVSVAKVRLPDAGLWIHQDGSWSLSLHGFANAQEVLGPWLPLYGPLLCLLGWLALNRMLRSLIRRGRRGAKSGRRE